MILRRLGNKKKLAHKIIEYFPDHKIYIEPFFGAGGKTELLEIYNGY